jgi:hypothetical protein
MRAIWDGEIQKVGGGCPISPSLVFHLEYQWIASFDRSPFWLGMSIRVFQGLSPPPQEFMGICVDWFQHFWGWYGVVTVFGGDSAPHRLWGMPGVHEVLEQIIWPAAQVLILEESETGLC